MKLFLFLILLQLLPIGYKNRLLKDPLCTLIKAANDSCILYDLGGKKDDGRFVHNGWIEPICQSLRSDGFQYNSEKDTLLLHILYTNLVIKIDSVSAHVDAYSSLGESHLTIDGHSTQPSICEYHNYEIERLIRANPDRFPPIYERYGEPYATDVAYDRILRIVIENGEITSVSGWIYKIISGYPNSSHGTIPVTFDAISLRRPTPSQECRLQRDRDRSRAPDTLDWCGNVVLEQAGNGTKIAKRLRTEEGYVDLTAGTGTTARRYFVRDHLGSVRAVVDGSGTSLETDDYYPLGGPLPTDSNTTLQPEKYQGKDWNPTASFNVYDFGARLYDPALGRWLSQDPLAEKYYAHSPYLFCAANPMRVIDPSGMDGIYITFPKYKADGYPLTGHAGVLLIDNKTGLTKYYEYGRYDSAGKGIVRHYSVPNVEMKDGMPTAESLNNVLTTISKNSGKGQILEGAYVKSDLFEVMNEYAKTKFSENSNINRTPYNVLTNNCGTFADEVIKQDKTIAAPFIIDPRPVSIIKEYQKKFTPISYDPGKGILIKAKEQTTSYNNQTKTTEIEQNWWQKMWYGIRK